MESVQYRATHYDDLLEKLQSTTAVVGIVGLGYVGLPLGVAHAKAGFAVIGLDDNPVKVANVNDGHSYIADISSAELAAVVAAQKFTATTRYDELTTADVIIICVPTPLTVNKEPDLSYVISVAYKVRGIMRPGQLIILESTTYPGTTEDVVQPILETSGLRMGDEFFLAFSPERVNPGDSQFQTKNTPKLVGGVTKNCQILAAALYQQSIDRVVPVSSPKIAELSKVFENTYRAVNIALVNELALLCDKMGISVWEVLDSAATKPFGIQIFHPGPGVGGHCIPLDPFYLSWKAKEYDFTTRFIELAGEINLKMPFFVFEKVTRALNAAKKAINGSRILLLGVAYKADVNDERESPALKVLQLLADAGADVSYHDHYVPKVKPHSFFNREATSIPLTSELLQAQDAVVITTAHSSIDYQWIVENSAIVIDTRNATENVVRYRERIMLL